MIHCNLRIFRILEKKFRWFLLQLRIVFAFFLSCFSFPWKEYHHPFFCGLNRDPRSQSKGRWWWWWWRGKTGKIWGMTKIEWRLSKIEYVNWSGMRGRRSNRQNPLKSTLDYYSIVILSLFYVYYHCSGYCIFQMEMSPRGRRERGWGPTQMGKGYVYFV